MVEKYTDSKIPVITPKTAGGQEPLNSAELNNCFDNLQFNQAIAIIQAHINRANQFIERSAPWKMAKENNPELPEVLWKLIGSIKVAAAFLYPFMPEISEKIWAMIGETESVENAAKRFFSNKDFMSAPISGNQINKSGPLFPRIQPK